MGARRRQPELCRTHPDPIADGHPDICEPDPGELAIAHRPDLRHPVTVAATTNPRPLVVALNLALMLASARREDAMTMRGLAHAAQQAGHSVRLFLVGEGVRSLDVAVELAAEGVDASLCEADAATRGIIKTGQRGVFFGSLYDWARLVEDADRVLSLG